MKIKNLFYFVFLSLIVGSFALISCEGPAGPPGEDGIDGVDGNAVCLTCHNAANKALINAAYATSGHGIGGAVAEEGARLTCAMCHSHEGFLETQMTGMDTIAEEYSYIPTPIGCGTCHDFHATLDFETDGPDYALRTTEPVSLLMNHAITLDLGSNSNLCANCHQPRTAYTYPFAADSFQITSSRFGPHYGPPSTVLYGTGGCDIPGSMAYATPGATTHLTGGGCIKCHMHSGTDATVGGHTWHTSLESCVECHTGATNFDINGVQTEIEGLIAELETELLAIGIITVNTSGSITGVLGKYPSEQAAALYNYRTAYYDHSLGIHNPAYIKALLVNSLEAIQ